ncbi:Predicted oxidoreductase of the aldo/keto reductase family [Butyrivibrio sp. ob235]|uniref:aldo/keto reductase n=1 Tax=Butyrivibrio sp. ob235 TaxID=1761780 RepID=UPI0008CE30A3|nr:aldo/keto reductase [Butyrivibrio sp. ob235]SEK63459.1 Predicted oxidoreductase of the aldo/keto reductase family [Butyrivibrio sp. ob235]
MKNVTLGRTGITVPQNGFGALPIQRIPLEDAVKLLRKAYDGGMRFFDTARAYSDSEEKVGAAFGDGYVKREDIVIATKTGSKTPEEFWEHLETSLDKLKTSYIDIYQFHLMNQCWKPDDGTGMYECMIKAKEQGKIKHIGGTAHKIGIAKELAESGLYESVQYPMSYLATDQEIDLIHLCNENNVGFICMKGLAGGLITNSKAAMAFANQFDGLVPIWGIQRETELNEWLSYMDETPQMDAEIREFIESERKELMGDFCRGCGYCMPCTVGIQINQCNRMTLMLRRAPSDGWLSEYWQAEMNKIEECVNCGACLSKCPYELQIPELLKKNLVDYREVLAGNRKVK